MSEHGGPSPADDGLRSHDLVFERMAAGWKRFESAWVPVADALVARLPDLPPGATVLDIACGTGEPGLSVATARPGVHLLGVDLTPAMVEIAGREARQRGQGDARFAVMDAQELDLDDGFADLVVSRMGLLGMPNGSPAMAREAHRVLAPGGTLAVAVWDRLATNRITDAVTAAFRTASGTAEPDFGWVDDQAVDGRRERWLRDAGFTDVASEPLVWDIALDAADLWDMVATYMFPDRFAALDDDGRAALRVDLAGRLAPYERDDGSYVIPHSCRIITARR